ncbi:lytic murein transglycosylase B [Halomonas sp. MCCC 1A17488]|uniref:Lytic murein transglycosylase B n=1 Tax=Billgrantia sulfidoxydans TaxID=2733484 RepID=A0ABX7W940_9GAMM|nr:MULTISPECIES: lytic murein transglycosylase B [Halomonas]MCE8014691.1 lytic murein transglycosylase B [Halomonas sp. MCCC 1A17488]MCG3238024.1 lytic murein transglycosylase B [Halomonas sp. MCCC 1A17488]QPP48198.1 lytic murein transglycosylase B [Halomonas sp. SS10-MC5]QTP55499.1 lytic murein transglycosylase B [Halomonas sulfidoxydans]
MKPSRKCKGAGAAVVTMALWWAAPAVHAADFSPAEHEGARQLLEELAGRGIERGWLEAALDDAAFQQGVLDAMAGAAERRLRWDEYRAIFLQPERISRGVAFIEAHEEAFSRAQAEYGVPPEIIAAIIGVETSYGRFTGRHRVIDSLATLAFHHPVRGSFFRGELAAFLEISHEQEVEPGSLTGSYAGAMGYPQFIPSSYRAYAVDFDGDGQRDLWTNPVDAIGSVANYFAEHGWRPGEPIYTEAEGPATPPGAIEFNQTRRPYQALSELERSGVDSVAELDESTRVIPLALEVDDTQWRYRLGYENFYVITRYNHSHLYAMAVTELAEAIAELRELEPFPLSASVSDEQEGAL